MARFLNRWNGVIKRRRSNRLYIALAIGGVVVIAGSLGLLGPVRWAYDRTVMPIGRGLSGLGSGSHGVLSELGQIGRLQADNKRLSRENASLRARLAGNAELARENEVLRQQLGLNVAVPRKQIAAQVVAYQPDSYRQFITINRGKRDGLVAGQAVTSGGMLVGTLSQVDNSTAKVLLISDPVFKLAGRVQASGATGIVQGQLGAGLVMTEIGQTDVVKPADTVVTSGLGGVVPEGIIIGQIQTVRSQQNGIFQTADIATEVKPTSLSIVFVVVGP